MKNIILCHPTSKLITIQDENRTEIAHQLTDQPAHSIRSEYETCRRCSFHLFSLLRHSATCKILLIIEISAQNSNWRKKWNRPTTAYLKFEILLYEMFGTRIELLQLTEVIVQRHLMHKYWILGLKSISIGHYISDYCIKILFVDGFSNVNISLRFNQ